MTSIDRRENLAPQAPSLTSASPSAAPLHFDLEVAKGRDEVRLGHFAEAIARLERLTAGPATPGLPLSPASMGSALAVLGSAYLGSGNQHQAETVRRRALDLLDPVHTTLTPRQWTDRGAALWYSTSRLDDAIEALETARNLHPEPDPETLAMLGFALREAGRLAEAEEALRTAVAIAPEPNVQLGLAEVARALEREDAAALYEHVVSALLATDQFQLLTAALDGLLSLVPDHPTALAAKGELLRRMNHQGEAIAALERAIEAEPGMPFSRASLGALLAAEPGRESDALVHLDHALAAQPEYPFAEYWRMVALRGVGRHEEAIQVADRLIDDSDIAGEALKIKGMALRDLGRLDDSLAAFRRLVELRPDDLEARGMLSMALASMGKNEEALEQIDAVLAARLDAGALGTKAEILRALGHDEEALTPLRQSMEIEPSEWAMMMLSQLLAELGRPLEALGDLDRVLSENPENAAALRVKGRLLADLGREEEAIAALEASTRIEPVVWACIRLSDLLRAENRASEALDAADSAVGLEKDNAEALGTRAQALRALGRTEEALADLDRALARRQDRSWIYLEKAGIHESANDLEQAVRTYEAGLAANPHDVALRVAIAVDQRNLGRLDEAEANVRRAVELDPGSTMAAVELSEVLFAQGRYDDALDSAEAVLAAQPNHGRATQLKGQLLVIRGSYDDALPVLETAIELDPAFAWGHGLKAIALTELDRLSEAIVAIDQALSILPDDPTLLTQKALIHVTSAEYDEAIATLERMDPESTAAWDAETIGWAAGIRGVAYGSAGRHAEAERALLTAVDRRPSDTVMRIWLAEEIRVNGRIDEGDALLRQVIDDASELQGLSAIDLGNIGWAHRLLGEFEKAASLLVRAVSKDPSMVWGQFEFALTLLCSGADTAAIREYQRGIDQLRRWPDPRRRFGLVSVALADLDDAAARRYDRPVTLSTWAVDKVRALLAEHLNALAAQRKVWPERQIGGSVSAARAGR